MEAYILSFLNMDLKHLNFVSYLCVKIDQRCLIEKESTNRSIYRCNPES